MASSLKKVKSGIEKMNKLFKNILTDITEMSDPIYNEQS